MGSIRFVHNIIGCIYGQVEYLFNKKINFKGICNNLIKVLNLKNAKFGFVYLENDYYSKINLIILTKNTKEFGEEVIVFYNTTTYKSIPYSIKSLEYGDFIMLSKNFKPRTIYREIY